MFATAFNKFELSAVVTRADGTVEDLGVIASTDCSIPAPIVGVPIESPAEPSLENTMNDEPQTAVATTDAGVTQVGASIATQVIPSAQVAALLALKAEAMKLQVLIAAAEREAGIAAHFANSEGLPHGTDQENDEALLRAAGGLMEARLAESRAAGKSGWIDTTDDLAAKAREQIDAGQLLDGAIYALMALVHASMKTA